MQQVVIELPDDVARQVGSYRDRLRELVLLGLFQLKAQEALSMYTRGIVSFGRATEIAGLSHSEMVRQVRAVGVKPRWSEQMVEEELDRSRSSWIVDAGGSRDHFPGNS